MKRILLHTADPSLAHFFPTLWNIDYTVQSIATEEWTRRALLADPFAAVVLDAQLPQAGERCERLRAATDAPLIVLAATDKPAERVALLAAGADDVIAAPLQSLELMARFNAKMRRFAATTNGKPMLMSPASPTRERHPKLSPMETRILTTLRQHDGAFVPLETLQRELWDEAGNENRLRFHICHLRRRLASFEHNLRIEGQRGIGYRLVH